MKYSMDNRKLQSKGLTAEALVRGALIGMVMGSGWTKSDDERKWYNDGPNPRSCNAE